jgi:phospholipase C
VTIKGLPPLVVILAMTACSSFDSASGRYAQDDTLKGGTLPAAQQSMCHPERSIAKRCGVEGRRTAPGSPIQHVVFIIQENRSFNNLFMGYPGATTQNFGYDSKGKKIALHAQGLDTSWDLDHSSQTFFNVCDGQGSLPGTDCKMDGWDTEGAGFKHPPKPAYAYTPKKEIQPYWEIANQYVIADQMFASNLDASFIAHQYAIAAYASHTVDSPGFRWGCEGGKSNTIGTLTNARTFGPRIVACFDNPTIGSKADKAGVSWRYYTSPIYSDGGLWSAYQADGKIYKGPDWKNDVITPQSQFLTDVAGGKLANVTWITPTYEASDHAGFSSNQGPAWIASLVDAIGASKFWGSTAIFIMWDDWGGWFDPVPPVYEDYDGLGFRVPLLVISPYAKQGSVTHTQYETASVLRYMEDNFGLPQLATSDARANDPAADLTVFDYGQSPRAFKKISGSKPLSYWIRLERNSRFHGKPETIIGDD